MSSVGEPPEWLGASGRRAWRLLTDKLADELRDLDRPALTLACAAYQAAEEALKDLSERGPLVEGDRGMVKNPSNQVAREQAQAFRQWCAEFGLTPRARLKLDIELGGDPSDSDDLID